MHSAQRPFNRPTEVGKNPAPKPPLMALHELFVQYGAYEGIDERRRTLMQRYFTTDATQAALAPVAGLKWGEGVHLLLLTGTQQALEKLPPEVREAYPSANAVLRLKSHQTRAETMRRVIQAHKAKFSRIERLREGNQTAETSSERQEASEPSEEYVSVEEAARLLDVDARSVRRWLNDGLLEGKLEPHNGRYGKRWLVKKHQNAPK